MMKESHQVDLRTITLGVPPQEVRKSELFKEEWKFSKHIKDPLNVKKLYPTQNMFPRCSPKIQLQCLLMLLSIIGGYLVIIIFNIHHHHHHHHYCSINIMTMMIFTTRKRSLSRSPVTTITTNTATEVVVMSMTTTILNIIIILISIITLMIMINTIIIKLVIGRVSNATVSVANVENAHHSTRQS